MKVLLYRDLCFALYFIKSWSPSLRLFHKLCILRKIRPKDVYLNRCFLLNYLFSNVCNPPWLSNVAGIGSVDQSRRIQCPEQALPCQYGNIMFFWLPVYGRRRRKPKDNWTDWCCSGFSAGEKCSSCSSYHFSLSDCQGGRENLAMKKCHFFCSAFEEWSRGGGRLLLTIPTFAVLSITETASLVKGSDLQTSSKTFLFLYNLFLVLLFLDYLLWFLF